MAVMAIIAILPLLTSLDCLKGLEAWPRRLFQLCDRVSEGPVYKVFLQILSHLKTKGEIT